MSAAFSIWISEVLAAGMIIIGFEWIRLVRGAPDGAYLVLLGLPTLIPDMMFVFCCVSWVDWKYGPGLINWDLAKLSNKLVEAGWEAVLGTGGPFGLGVNEIVPPFGWYVSLVSILKPPVSSLAL